MTNEEARGRGGVRGGRGRGRGRGRARGGRQPGRGRESGGHRNDDEDNEEEEEDIDDMVDGAQTLIPAALADLAALVAESQDIEDNNLEVSTKHQYMAKVVHIIKFFSKVWPDVMFTASDGTQAIDISRVNDNMFTIFLASFCKKKRKVVTATATSAEQPSPTIQPAETAAAAGTTTTSEPTVRYEYYSFQHINGYWSAFSYYIKDVMHHNVPESMRLKIKRFLAGYERRIEKLKTNGEMAIDSGKAPLSFGGVRFLGRVAFTSAIDVSLGISVHLFMLLSWNLLARCISIASLCFDHFSWAEDCMTVVFPTHKGDKEGKNAVAKHVYANPLNPVMCPILSLAIFVFTKGIRLAGSSTIVFGGQAKQNENIFSKWLSKICKDNAEELLSVGVKAENVGTHSFRKGMATFLNGIPGGPSPIAIFLRAGWSLGRVVSSYILNGLGGDNLCGRCATGLDITSKEFSLLPPHFCEGDGPILTQEQWHEFLPGYVDYYPESFRRVVPYLVAQLSYHHTFLDQQLPAFHPLRNSRIWKSGVLITLQGRLRGGTIAGTTPMKPTGIPPHVVIASEVSDLRGEVGELRKELKDLRELLIELLRGLPESVKQLILSTFRVDGAIPFTQNDAQHMFDNLLATVQQSITTVVSQTIATNFAALMGNNANHPLGLGQHAHPTATIRPGAVGDDERAQYLVHTWGNRLRLVPEDFAFPR